MATREIKPTTTADWVHSVFSTTSIPHENLTSDLSTIPTQKALWA